LSRITCDPAVLAGKPVVRGTRLSLAFITGVLAQGVSVEDLMREYSGLALEDIKACLLFSSRR
jgi:uncharacterized protein (DUF433 family)